MTAHVVELRPFTLAGARAVVAGERRDDWADDYPSEGDLVVAGLVAMSGEEPRSPWCSYEVVETSTGLVVGGAGFKGAPRLGVVEIGYGLVPSARGRGLATRAVEELVRLAAGDPTVVAVVADTEPGNAASQRVLLRAGFADAGESDGLRLFRRPLAR